MSDTPSYKVAQAVGILASAFASGGILSLSTLTVPALTLPGRSETIKSDTPASTPSHITHQWLNVYDKGKIMFPSLALTSAVAYSYLAYTLRHTASAGRVGRLYLIAAATTITIVPFTLGVMLPVNKRLEAHATRDDAAEKEGKEGMAMSVEEEAKRAREDREVPGLLEKWSYLNAGRSVFPLAGAVIGITAVLFY
ncbi:hypothetical protein DTO166G4_3673 [Paecilomyces variotii]|nr:hypothetical protein DTO166G4_3673 [Paecilomyces variotii]KAJ9230702.1 hypothetical protein DTO166G5_7215 [Paecilomyces variotii]KAJ9262219.1 hypothetical protein DTO195F2_3606 [Paecilomyces variotii]KAJ9368118.1 hypothetical protein DTO282E5_7234 [Paecilomyces variotii]